MFKVFIGTLYCHENDFEHCCDMINRQKNISITHNIIENLPEAEAHKQQTQNWLDCKKDFDYFIKIDADTVLRDENVLNDICTRMSKEKINYLQYGLFDFLTQTQIYGLNSFDTTIKFTINVDKLFCDRNFIRDKNTKTIIEPTIMGTHMFFCSEIQAFHYGLHRGKKEQTHLIEKIKIANKQNVDRRRQFAIKGFEIAQKFSGTFNYNSPEFIACFEEISKTI